MFLHSMNPELEAHLNYLFNNYNLREIIAFLNEYLESKVQDAETMDSKHTETWHNISGFAVMMMAELEKIKT